jgi:hypothetical protein
MRAAAPSPPLGTSNVTDENAFGVLVAIYDLENLEYSLTESAFLEIVGRFEQAIETQLATEPLAEALRQLKLGHARYLEFADGEQLVDPIAWVRRMRQQLIQLDLPCVCVLSAGGRWVELQSDDASIATVGPSEPLRKALAAEAFAQPTTSAENDDSWGPGLYIEKDAIEQLGKSLKNTPTGLPALSTLFYRIGA